MGLTAWTGSRVLKRDVTTAKNYLNEREIDTLNRIVVMFLDQAEFRAQRRRRLEAGASADAHYLDDLRTSARTLETERKKLSAPAKRQKDRKPKRGGAPK